MQDKQKISFTPIPTKWVGPVLINSEWTDKEQIQIPLATFEIPLWPSVNRGARVLTQSGGLNVTMTSEQMTRSIAFNLNSAVEAHEVATSLSSQFEELDAEIRKKSRFTRLKKITPHFLGNNLYLRLSFTTGDASGHNMSTQASEIIQKWLLKKHPQLRYGSISANMCTDKKASAINGLLGRGREMIAECVIPKRILTRYLRTTADRMVKLHICKNLNGSILAGSLRSANAHFANMLLAFYLATGQDAANIVEGSQGMTHLEARDEDLYFSVTIPNLIVGSVGNGKNNTAIIEHLEILGCRKQRNAGDNARRLAVIAAAAVACGELSLLAAQTNEGELVESHLRLER